MSFIKAKIKGIGSHVPDKILSNYDLEKLVDTSDEWIKSRTGMSERRVASTAETASTLGAEAAKKALKHASMSPLDLDLIIVATGSADMLFPSTACLIQNIIGATNAAAFDISAACSGFIFSLSIAEQYLATGKYKTILLVASEVISKYVDWTDRGTCILFGDGAAALVIQRDEEGEGGIFSTHIYSDGLYSDLLYLRGGGSSCPISYESIDNKAHLLKMKGSSLFKIAVKKMIDSCKEALAFSEISISDIDLVIPHQANIRIINAISSSLGIPDEKMFINIEKYGNTVAATIPLALADAVEQGRVKDGDILLMVAFGGGLTWGSAVIKW